MFDANNNFSTNSGEVLEKTLFEIQKKAAHTVSSVNSNELKLR